MDTTTDVVIIGGGMAGVLSAYFLARAGKKVMLLEQHTLGSGATSLTTAFVTQLIDTDQSDLIKMFGAHTAKLVWESGGAAIQEIQKIVERERIACDFAHCVAYIYARNPREFRELKKEQAALGRIGGSSELISEHHLPFTTSGYLKVPGQAKFSAEKFLHAVAAAAVAAGAQIHEHTTVVHVSDAGSVEITTTRGHSITAKDVIVATYAPFNNPKGTHFKKAMYRSYVMRAQVPGLDFPEGIYWDQENPYTYFRVDGERITLGGADHRADLPIDPKKNFHALTERLKELIGEKAYTMTDRWMGPILESIDGLPYIGAYAPHRYAAFAFSGNGMTYSVVAAALLRDRILGHHTPLASVYDPRRHFTLYGLMKMGMHYTRELLGGWARNLFRR